MSTYILISSQVLGSSTASVTFSSIPQTYKDLVLRVSARTDYAGPNELLIMTFNGTGGTSYSNTTLIGNGSTVVSNRTSSAAYVRNGYIDGSTATTNTFANTEIYIPSYTASQNKPISNFSVAENNSATAADAYINANASLATITSAITSITFASINTSNFVLGSSFYLYGI